MQANLVHSLMREQTSTEQKTSDHVSNSPCQIDRGRAAGIGMRQTLPAMRNGRLDVAQAVSPHIVYRSHGSPLFRANADTRPMNTDDSLAPNVVHSISTTTIVSSPPSTTLVRKITSSPSAAGRLTKAFSAECNLPRSVGAARYCHSRQDTRPDQAGGVHETNKTHGNVMEGIYETIKGLREETQQMKITLESKLCALERNLMDSVRLKLNLMRNDFDIRVCAIETDWKEHAAMKAALESRLSAMDLHSTDHNEAVTKMKTDMENRFRSVEEQIGRAVSLIQKDSIHKDKTDQTETITKLKSVLEGRLAGMRHRHASDSKAVKETMQEGELNHRIGMVEGNIDLIASILRSMESKITNFVEEGPTKPGTEDMHTNRSKATSTNSGSSESSTSPAHNDGHDVRSGSCENASAKIVVGDPSQHQERAEVLLPRDTSHPGVLHVRGYPNHEMPRIME